MQGSIQDKLLRVRPPRVRITYDVETNNAIQKRELPFIVGIFADLSGAKRPDLPAKDRKFIEIDRDNFDKVLAAASPSAKISQDARARVPVLKDMGSVEFKSLADFTPLGVVRNVDALRAKYEARARLRALQAKAESSDPLANALEQLLAPGPQGDEQRVDLVGKFGGKTAEQWPQVALDPGLRALLNALPNAAQPDPDGSLRTVNLQQIGQFAQVLDIAAERLSDLYKLSQDSSDLAVALNDVTNTKAKRDALTTAFAPGGAAAAWTGVQPAGDVKPAFDAAVGAIKKAYFPDPAADEADTQAQAYAKKLLGQYVQSVVKPAVDDLTQNIADLDPLKKALSNTDLATELNKLLADNTDGSEGRRAMVALFLPAQPETWATVAPAATSVAGILLAKAGDEKAPMVKALGRFTQLFLTDWIRPKQGDTPKAAADLIEGLALNVDSSTALKQASGDRDAGAIISMAAAIDEQVAAFDQELAKALDVILHDENFQKLEATWRGMFYLISRAETGERLKLRVINLAKEELYGELKKAVEFDQSSLFKMIYEGEYGAYGGAPYSLLIGDYEFGRSPTDIDLLNKIAEVAAASHAPFIAAANSGLFGLDSFESLAKPRDLQKLFESEELIAWRSFRDSEDSRYVTLTLPRVLLRLPYGRALLPAEGLNYEETVGIDTDLDSHVEYVEPNSKKFLWGNPSYILAERITNSFSLYGWTAAIRGVEGGGLVSGLPTYAYRSIDRDIRMICPTQVSITDRREKELNDLGFLPLCHCKGTDKAAFFGGQTTNKPKKYISDLATSNAYISAMLPYMLSASRFAHYIKVIMREKVGSFMPRSMVESFLGSWIAQYVLLDDNATQEIKARFPLSEAKVIVTEVPGAPGSYAATVFLRPHFQLEELTTSIRLVAKLPS